MDGVNASLIKKCQQSDEQSLFALYGVCYPMMKGIAKRYVFDRECHGEVVNIGFVKIVKGLDKFDFSMPFMPWAATVMIRVAIDHVRKVMRQKAKQPIDYMDDLSPVNHKISVHNLADMNFDADALLSLLDTLPLQTKTVFNLFAIDGYSHAEIAERLDISAGTSKWHVSKARQKLQSALLDTMNKKEINYEPSN